MNVRGSVATIVGLLVAGCSFDPSGAGGPKSDLGGDHDAAAGADARTGLGGGGADASRSDATRPGPPGLCDVDDDTLVACFEFDGDLLDLTANDNDLVATDTAFAPGVGGDGDGLLLSNDSEVVGPTASPSLDFTDRMTLEAWIRADVDQQRWFVDHDGQWGLEVQSDGDLRCTVRTLDDGGSDNANDVEGGVAVPGVFTHVACVYDGAQVTLYQDGLSVASSDATGAIATAASGGFSVGQDAPGGPPFVGLVDRVRIWSRDRSPAEIGCSFQQSC